MNRGGEFTGTGDKSVVNKKRKKKLEKKIEESDNETGKNGSYKAFEKRAENQ